MEQSAKHEGSEVPEERESSSNGAPAKRETLTLKKINAARAQNQPSEDSGTSDASDNGTSDKADMPDVPKGESEFGEIWESEGGKVHRVPNTARKVRGEDS